MVYQVALDHNNADELEALDPQPASPGGIRPARRTYAASGQVRPDGELLIDLVYTILEHNQRNAIDLQCGVNDSLLSRDVTVSVRVNDHTFANYNAVVERMDAERGPLGWKNAIYRLHLVEAL